MVAELETAGMADMLEDREAEAWGVAVTGDEAGRCTSVGLGINSGGERASSSFAGGFGLPPTRGKYSFPAKDNGDAARIRSTRLLSLGEPGRAGGRPLTSLASEEEGGGTKELWRVGVGVSPSVTSASSSS